MAEIALMAGHARSLVNFRGPLIERLLAGGHAVSAISPALDHETAEWLRLRGVRHEAVRLGRTGLNPLQDAATLLQFARAIGRLRPDITLPYTIKPVIYGSIAARWRGVQHRYALITGRGAALDDGGARQRILAAGAGHLYRHALKGARAVMFQNVEDSGYFAAHGLLDPGTRVVVVAGSGIDVSGFPAVPVPPGAPHFLFVGRLLRAKGVTVLAEAMLQLRTRWPSVRCTVVGPVDDAGGSVSAAEMERWTALGIFAWTSWTPDVRPHLAASSVFVLPSWYREGVPRTLLEALATGRAIVTTDWPGCRDTVVPGVNGFLVPVRDVSALVAALTRFCENEALAARFGAESRRLAEERFDVRKVNDQMIATMQLA